MMTKHGLLHEISKKDKTGDLKKKAKRIENKTLHRDAWRKTNIICQPNDHKVLT